MSAYVVDASVAAKWFFKEHDSAAAVELLAPANKLYAPDLLWSEVGNATWKRIRRKDLPAAEAAGIVADFERMPVEYTAVRELLSKAIDLAVSGDRTVYDCLYLALAIEINCPLITADERFFNALAATPLKKYMQLLGHSLNSDE